MNNSENLINLILNDFFGFNLNSLQDIDKKERILERMREKIEEDDGEIKIKVDNDLLNFLINENILLTDINEIEIVASRFRKIYTSVEISIEIDIDCNRLEGYGLGNLRILVDGSDGKRHIRLPKFQIIGCQTESIKIYNLFKLPIRINLVRLQGESEIYIVDSKITSIEIKEAKSIKRIEITNSEINNELMLTTGQVYIGKILSSNIQKVTMSNIKINSNFFFKKTTITEAYFNNLSFSKDKNKKSMLMFDRCHFKIPENVVFLVKNLDKIIFLYTDISKVSIFIEKQEEVQIKTGEETLYEIFKSNDWSIDEEIIDDEGFGESLEPFNGNEKILKDLVVSSYWKLIDNFDYRGLYVQAGETFIKLKRFQAESSSLLLRVINDIYYSLSSYGENLRKIVVNYIFIYFLASLLLINLPNIISRNYYKSPLCPIGTLLILVVFYFSFLIFLAECYDKSAKCHKLKDFSKHYLNKLSKRRIISKLIEKLKMKKSPYILYILSVTVLSLLFLILKAPLLLILLISLQYDIFSEDKPNDTILGILPKTPCTITTVLLLRFIFFLIYIQFFIAIRRKLERKIRH